MDNNFPRPDVIPQEPRVCHSPLDGSADDMSDKEANKPILFRCLLLLLPVGIPVVVYLKDIDAMRRIFLTAFILLLVIVFSCMMVALLRKRRRHLEGETSNSEIARELAHRHLMAMTHRFLPRQPLPHSGRCNNRDCGVDFTMEEFRRPGHACRASFGRFPGHYHLAPTRSRSPSPQGAMFASGALPLLSLHFPRLVMGQPDEIPVRSDDPPPYEDAILCPPSDFPVAERHSERFPPETPPPSYDTAVA